MRSEPAERTPPVGGGHVNAVRRVGHRKTIKSSPNTVVKASELNLTCYQVCWLRILTAKRIILHYAPQ